MYSAKVQWYVIGRLFPVDETLPKQATADDILALAEKKLSRGWFEKLCALRDQGMVFDLYPTGTSYAAFFYESDEQRGAAPFSFSLDVPLRKKAEAPADINYSYEYGRLDGVIKNFMQSYGYAREANDVAGRDKAAEDLSNRFTEISQEIEARSPFKE